MAALEAAANNGSRGVRRIARTQIEQFSKREQRTT
jgi:hypothetical protein